MPIPLLLAVPVAAAVAAAADMRELRELLPCDEGHVVALVSKHGEGNASLGDEYDGVCHVAVAAHQHELPARYDYVLTDSLSWVSWLGRSGVVHFLDSLSWRLEDYAGAMERKERLLSILFPPYELWDDVTEALHAEALALGQECFVDDGTEETYDAAFQGARYTWILEERNTTIHPGFIRALGHHTLPIFSGWVLYTNMFHNAVLRFPPERGLDELLWQLHTMVDYQEDISLSQYNHMILDILLYRYRAAPSERFHVAACTLCRPQAALAVVGVYSALRNYAKRMAIRQTWGRLLAQSGIRLQFFLGEVIDKSDLRSGGTDLHDAEVQAALEEQHFGDMVRLPVPEGYVQNARKGLAFLRYMAERHPDATFCIKVDDDVYWRPEALLRTLQRRVPFRYVWGFLDLSSPVPREQRDAFFHTTDEWPDDIFPPYPRGALRVLSMDVVRLIAQAHYALHMGVVGDDPSLGVHLRQLVMQFGSFLQLDDRGANSRFAMEPTCRTEGAYCPLKETTWVVHHISSQTVRCMFRADLRAGYYQKSHDGTLFVAPSETFPSLCRCVDRRQRNRLHSGRGRWLRQQCAKRPEGGIRA